MRNSPIIIERTFNLPAEKIWQAITDKDQMQHWYFDLAEFKAEVDFEFQFAAGPDEKPYIHLCKVTEAIPSQKLSYSWRYDGYEGNSFVTFELFPEGSNTRLRLTHLGLDTFPRSNPDFAKENFADGWTSIIGTSLKDYLEK